MSKKEQETSKDLNATKKELTAKKKSSKALSKVTVKTTKVKEFKMRPKKQYNAVLKTLTPLLEVPDTLIEANKIISKTSKNSEGSDSQCKAVTERVLYTLAIIGLVKAIGKGVFKVL